MLRTPRPVPLGGIVQPTNVEGILQLNLLRTDYFHRLAYPTWLLYNPHPGEKQVEFTVGAEPRDLYDAVAKEFVRRGVRGVVRVTISADTARVLVVTPAGGKRLRQGSPLLIDGWS